MEHFNFGEDKFRIVSREESLTKQWGNKYLGNPTDKLAQTFEEEFSNRQMVKEEVNGTALLFISYPFSEGGGYGFSIDASELYDNPEDYDLNDIWVSNDAEFAYPFYDAMKNIALKESDPLKLFSYAEIMATAIPKGIKKKGLSFAELTEIRMLKNKIGKWKRDVEPI